MPPCPPSSLALCPDSFTSMQHGVECLCRNTSNQLSPEAAKQSVRASERRSYAQKNANHHAQLETSKRLAKMPEPIITQGPKPNKEPFRGMDPMESSYGVVSYGENYSLVAFGLFAILLLLYKTTNNK